MLRSHALFRAGLFACAFFPALASAGVVNPDISLIGQLRPGWTDDPTSVDKNRPTLNLGEAEVAADAALNPYASGTFVFSFADGQAEVEEAYLRLDQALPWGLALKAGKYRAPLGKLNPTHPHAYDFIDPPHILESSSGLIPGEESWNEPAVELSALLPGIATWAPVLSVDVQKGAGFRTSQDTAPALSDYDSEREKTDLAWLVHLSNGFTIGDGLAGDLGFSLSQGTSNVERDLKATIAGADLKLKFDLGEGYRLAWQSEAIWRHDDHAERDRLGWVSILDWTRGRWNLGGLYEQLSFPSLGDVDDQSAKVFGGFSLLEESTLFRLAYERRWQTGIDPVNTVSAQILFSMGPHKPHQF